MLPPIRRIDIKKPALGRVLRTTWDGVVWSNGGEEVTHIMSYDLVNTPVEGRNLQELPPKLPPASLPVRRPVSGFDTYLANGTNAVSSLFATLSAIAKRAPSKTTPAAAACFNASQNRAGEITELPR